MKNSLTVNVIKIFSFLLIRLLGVPLNKVIQLTGFHLSKVDIFVRKHFKCDSKHQKVLQKPEPDVKWAESTFNIKFNSQMHPLKYKITSLFLNMPPTEAK